MRDFHSRLRISRHRGNGNLPQFGSGNSAQIWRLSNIPRLFQRTETEAHAGDIPALHQLQHIVAKLGIRRGQLEAQPGIVFGQHQRAGFSAAQQLGIVMLVQRTHIATGCQAVFKRSRRKLLAELVPDNFRETVPAHGIAHQLFVAGAHFGGTDFKIDCFHYWTPQRAKRGRSPLNVKSGTGA
ncbi:hypothetical protein D3C71_1018020 [compost metagenome]